MRHLHTTIALTALALGGCASAQSSEKLDETTAMMQTAEQAGAHQVPSAQYHLSKAEEHNEVAKQQLKSGDRLSAESTLDRSRADAELAVQLVPEEKGRQTTRRTAEQI